MRSESTFLRQGAPVLLGLLTAMAVGGCGAVAIVAPQADAGAVDVARVDVPAPQDIPTTRTCVRQSDCPSGSECVGPEGCGVPWTCVAGLGRPCTDDLASFCGCDGQTLTGSSSCPPGPYRARGACEPPLPRTCRSNTDCARGEQCQGPEGCGVTWTCSTGPVGCTADVANFCGCDGRTFQGSSSCPGQLFRHRGRCESADAGAPACAPVDARAEGACDLFLGYVWNGRQCAPLSGCRCVGPGCEQLVSDRDACLFAHTLCPR